LERKEAGVFHEMEEWVIEFTRREKSSYVRAAPDENSGAPTVQEITVVHGVVATWVAAN
jgi:hypothetical protein